VVGDLDVLPPEFITKTGNRGMLTSWCPQEEILKHPSIGGFLTHSGWNSTLEIVCGGVPLISWPFFAEQQTNCQYACIEWGIGMEIDNCHAPVLGYKGNANLSAKNKHFKWKRAFATYKFKSPTLLYLSINNSLQNLEFSKRNILYKIKILSVRNDLLLFASSTPIPRNDVILLGHLERVEQKKG
jgi:hypothetical protein